MHDDRAFAAILVGVISFVGIMLIILNVIGNASAETMYVNVSDGSWLNGRAAPDKHSDVECRFYSGDAVNVLETVGDWAKVDEGGEAACSYVALDYLSAEPGDEKTMRVSSNGRVRVREEPDGKVIGYVGDGDEVAVSFLFQGWAKTGLGWIDAGYLK